MYILLVPFLWRTPMPSLTSAPPRLHFLPLTVLTLPFSPCALANPCVLVPVSTTGALQSPTLGQTKKVHPLLLHIHNRRGSICGLQPELGSQSYVGFSSWSLSRKFNVCVHMYPRGLILWEKGTRLNNFQFREVSVFTCHLQHADF